MSLLIYNCLCCVVVSAAFVATPIGLLGQELINCSIGYVQPALNGKGLCDCIMGGH